MYIINIKKQMTRDVTLFKLFQILLLAMTSPTVVLSYWTLWVQFEIMYIINIKKQMTSHRLQLVYNLSTFRIHVTSLSWSKIILNSINVSLLKLYFQKLILISWKVIWILIFLFIIFIVNFYKLFLFLNLYCQNLLIFEK